MSAPSNALPRLRMLCTNSKRNRGTTGVSLVRCPDAGAADCVRATRSLPSYSHALHTSRRHLHRERTRLVRGSHSYGRSPRTANGYKCCTRPSQLAYRLVTLDIIDEILDVDLHCWTPVRDCGMGFVSLHYAQFHAPRIQYERSRIYDCICPSRVPLECSLIARAGPHISTLREALIQRICRYFAGKNQAMGVRCMYAYTQLLLREQYRHPRIEAASLPCA
jgi:hypothetical protein